MERGNVHYIRASSNRSKRRHVKEPRMARSGEPAGFPVPSPLKTSLVSPERICLFVGITKQLFPDND
jgi:hypothetical protein